MHKEDGRSGAAACAFLEACGGACARRTDARATLTQVQRYFESGDDLPDHLGHLEAFRDPSRRSQLEAMAAQLPSKATIVAMGGGDSDTCLVAEDPNQQEKCSGYSKKGRSMQASHKRRSIFRRLQISRR